MGVDELHPKHAEIVKTASLLYFDGRLTEPAIALAKAARAAGKLAQTIDLLLL